MKYYILGLLILVANSIKAGELKIVGPCKKRALLKHKFTLEETSTVGDITIKLLEKLRIPHVGSPRGLNSIFNTPIGKDALELINENEYYAHGWCYSVNGFEPGDYADEVKVESNDKIRWWFGYAHFKNGKWKTQCTPTYKRKPAQFCD